MAKEQTYIMQISIHASPKGGAPGAWDEFMVELISIHASPKGGDINYGANGVSTGNFSPRLPEGRRLLAHSAVAVLNDFNPRLPEGRRPQTAGAGKLTTEFQSTPPRREATRHMSVLMRY